MPSKISRYSAGGWVEVGNFDDFDIRLDVLEAKVNSTTGFINGTAEMGPRGGSWPTFARFGHASLPDNISGYLVQPDGTMELNVPLGKIAFIQEQGGSQIAQFAPKKSNVSGMGIGLSPPYGDSYASLWRNGSEGASDYILLANSSSTFLNAPTGGTIYFRRANADILTVGSDNKISAIGEIHAAGTIKANGNTHIGSNSIYFETHGGGWYMSDSVWVRSTGDKRVWLGGGWFGADGGITIGRGGVVDTNYRADFNCHCHVWSDLRVGGISGSDYQVRSTAGKADTGWPSAHILAYGTDSGAYQTRIAMHCPGVAPQIRVIATEGSQFQFVNEDSGAWVDCKAFHFLDQSTIRVKRDVRSLRPDRDFLPIELDPYSDTVDAPPDIMALRPVAYRPKQRQTVIVPTDPSGDYSTVIPDDPTTFESVPRMDFIGDQSNREVLGLIAEEVQHVIPSAVWHDSNKDADSIHYSQITVALLDHVQQLTATVQTLQYRIAELEENQ